jgi:hypothetical protein
MSATRHRRASDWADDVLVVEVIRGIHRDNHVMRDLHMPRASCELRGCKVQMA